MNLKQIPLTEIDPGRRFRLADNLNLIDLVPSLKVYGVLQSITLLEKKSVPGGVEHEKNEEAPYLLLAGGRRFYACQIAGIDKIPAIIRKFNELHVTKEELENAPKELIELKIREIELEENVQREGLNGLEEVNLTDEIHRCKQALYGNESHKQLKTSKPGWSLRDTAKTLKKNVATVHMERELAEAAREDPEVAEALKISKAEGLRVRNAKKRKAETAAAVKMVKEKRANTNEEKIKKQLIESYVIGDFFEHIGSIEDASLGLVELDPPWGIPIIESYEAGTRNSRPEDIDEFVDFKPEEYEKIMKVAIDESYRVLNDLGWLVLWYGGKTATEMNIRLLNEAGFKFDVMPCIWVKDLGGGFTRNAAYNLSYDYETFFLARKRSATIRDRGHSNVFPYKRVAGTKKIHRTEKPIELYQEIFSVTCQPGTPTLVGFAGSGNAILAAYNLGSDAKGFDLGQAFHDGFVLRVNEHKTGTGPFRSHDPGTARLF